MGQQKAKILSDRALRNRDCFDTGMDAEIKHLKAEAKKMLNLEAKVVAQRSVKDLEKKRGEKRVKLYQAQDEVDEKKETLLSTIEKMLAQKSSQEALLTIRWKIK